MKPIKVFASVVVCLLLAIGIAKAQGVGASGEIKGTVSDPTGAVVPNATVTATDAEKGIKHTSVTDDSGQYHVIGILPTTYNLTVERRGFQTEILKNIVVNVGQTVTLDFHMKVPRSLPLH